MPADDPLPPPIDVPADARDQRLLLAVPLRRAGELDSARSPVTDELVRQEVREFEVANAAVAASDPATLEVGALRTRLLLQREATEAYACVPLAHIVECRADQQVVLDDQFIPTILQLRATERLSTVATELLGLFHQRGEALGGRVSATSRGAASELADFLMLQAINRYEPLLAHFTESGVHPPRSVLSILCCRGRRARDVHQDIEAHTEISELPARASQGDIRAGDCVAARVDEQGHDAGGDSDPARAAEVRDQRRDRARSNALQLRGLHPGGASRWPCGVRAAAFPDAGQDRAGREASAISCARVCPVCRWFRFR